MNSTNDNQLKNNIENKLSSLSSSFRSGLKSLTESSSDNQNGLLSNMDTNEPNKFAIFGMDWKIFALIIVIFGLLGVNIFVYLAVGTQDIINLIKPLTMAITNFLQNIFGGSIANIFKNAIKGVHDLLFIFQGTIKGGVSATDQLMDMQSNNSDNSLNSIINTPQPSTQSYKQPTSLPQNVASNGSVNDNTSSVITTTSTQSSLSGQPNMQTNVSSVNNQQMTPLQNVSVKNVTKTANVATSLNNDALNNALNNALVESTSGNYSTNTSGGSSSNSSSTYNTYNYTADDSMSNIQQSKSSNKSGWCYIGEDRGFRSCIQVSENEKCMSGDIFPSQEICINPNLRQ
jgi:hypothetical protein